jgi:phospholipase C
VVTEEYRSTSVIRTLRERWPLGGPLTGRDAVAADIAPVLSLDSPRDPADWPAVIAHPVPPYLRAVPAPASALRGLGRAAFHACLALAEDRGRGSAALTADEDVSRARALELISDLGGDAFPHLRG